METFRIEVGRAHRVTPVHIVGAIANEAGLDSSYIGKIEIFDQFSTVDMLAGMPRNVFQLLQGVSVMGRRLNLSRLEPASDRATRPEGKRQAFKSKRAVSRT